MNTNTTKTIAIASDHAGFKLKQEVIQSLPKNIKVQDVGCFDTNPVDYPDYAKKVVKMVENNEVTFGILICFTGVGMSITANRNKNIRAALCAEPEQSKLARQHNNANILCIGARSLNAEKALEVIDSFANSEFEGGRHLTRVNKIDQSS